MPKPLPDDVIKHWPEVFKDIDIQTIPINYLHSIRIEFKKGKIWEVYIQKALKERRDNPVTPLTDEVSQMCNDAEIIINSPEIPHSTTDVEAFGTDLSGN